MLKDVATFQHLARATQNVVAPAAWKIAWKGWHAVPSPVPQNPPGPVLARVKPSGAVSAGARDSPATATGERGARTLSADLAVCPLVQQLDTDARDAFLAALTYRPFEKHELLIPEGNPQRQVQIVVRGAAMAWRRRHAVGAQVTGFLFPGDVLGALAGAGPRPGARAIAPGADAELPAAALSALTERHPSLRHALYRSVASDFALAQDHLTILGAMSASERLAAALLQLDRRQQARGFGPEVPLWLPMRRTDLASYLGLELPTLSRTFGRLRAANLIACTSTTGVLLRDRAALARLAGTATDAGAPSA